MSASLHTGYCLTLKSAGLAAKLPFSKATLAEKRREIIGLNENLKEKRIEKSLFHSDIAIKKM